MTLPWSMMMAKRPVRSSKFQPMLRENLASLSDMKSWVIVSIGHIDECTFGTYNAVVGDAVGLGPAVHDKGIVEGNNDDLVNALGLDLVDVLGVGRNVGAGAGGGESPGDGDEDDLLVLELCSQKVSM